MADGRFGVTGVSGLIPREDAVLALSQAVNDPIGSHVSTSRGHSRDAIPFSSGVQRAR
jgi:hypothetical protein